MLFSVTPAWLPYNWEHMSNVVDRTEAGRKRPDTADPSAEASTREPSSASALPAVHDGWMVLPILLLAQDDERLFLPNPHSLCIAARNFGWSLCLLSMQIWVWFCLSYASICFLLSTLALKEEILCEIQGSSSISSSSATLACWEKKKKKLQQNRSIVRPTVLPGTFLSTRTMCSTIALFNMTCLVVESLISPSMCPAIHFPVRIKRTTTFL